MAVPCRRPSALRTAAASSGRLWRRCPIACSSALPPNPRDRQTHKECVPDHAVQEQAQLEGTVADGRKRQDEVVHEQVNGGPIQQTEGHRSSLQNGYPPACNHENRRCHKRDEEMQNGAKPRRVARPPSNDALPSKPLAMYCSTWMGSNPWVPYAITPSTASSTPAAKPPQKMAWTRDKERIVGGLTVGVPVKVFNCPPPLPTRPRNSSIRSPMKSAYSSSAKCHNACHVRNEGQFCLNSVQEGPSRFQLPSRVRLR